MEQFYLDKIKLNNYRQFSDKEFIFDKNMNVLIGANSSGKTTVIEAVCVILGAYLAAFKKYVPSRFVFNITEMDVYRKLHIEDQKDVLISSDIAQYPCGVESCLHMDGEEYTFRRVLEKSGGRTKFDGNNPMQKTVVSWESTIAKATGEDQSLIFPLVLYLSSARLWNEDKNKSKSENVPSRLDGYYRCLDRKRGSQFTFNYLKKLSEISSQEKNGVQFPAYTLIMDAIRFSMKDELKSGERIEYSFRYNGLALVKADGTWIPFESMSDGYRGVIKIVTDIATRMCILNPYLKEETLKRTPGIVVIDELDLSLHPGWQKRIVNILQSLFPRVQFICASHSPFIIQSLKEGQLISMDGLIKDEYAGQSIEDIAEDIMGIPNPQYSDEKQEMYKLAEEFYQNLNQAKNPEDLKEIKGKLDLLIARFGDNPAYYAFLQQKYLEKIVE